MNYIDEQDIKTSFAVCMIQDYLQKLTLDNIDNKQIFKRIKRDILSLEKAQQALSVNVDRHNLLETLFLKML